jgi:two-component system, cell cycle sensor histidine kinase and response regulator CckA
MEAIGNLAGGIAHDFNNILSGIMGYSELCRIQMQDRPKACRSIEQILKATDRAKDLVQQILTFSRKTEREKKPLMLSPIVKEVVKFMRASLPTTIEIIQTIDVTSDTIIADPTQMHQVLMNLCTNAGHAMKEAGGVLEIGLGKIFIKAEDLLHRPSLRRGHYLELTVRDTGQGISQDTMVRIFEPYFTTKEKGEGTGMGLAVVHGIVKEHGGEIRVYSEVGKGTIFRVYLPLLEMQLEDEKDMEEAPLPGKGETILFVDDEKIVVDLNKQLLEGLGYRVMAETDPVRALEVYKEDPEIFDLLITDKTMPQLTGFDLAREIRSICTGMPVILCTGFQEKEDMGKLAADRINQFIIKPARISSMAKAIRDVLDKDSGTGTGG